MIVLFRRNLIDLPINYSLNYYWSSGFVLSMFMVLQIFTGVLLSFLYVADFMCSFFMVMNLSNDSFFTWCLRYWHMVGVNVLFILLFFHMGMALYYGSYIKKGVWNVGFVLYLLVMGEAFTGYILPWHQMSYWAATVLTSIVDSLPVVGPIVYKYVVGGFSVSGITLIRVLSVHICLGFVILGLMVVHLFYLHKVGNSNPLFSFYSFNDLVYFHSYFSIKDLVLFLVTCSLVVFWLFFVPDLLVDIEAYLEADYLNTPVSIKPEWYFLAFYAILRCINSKIGGLLLIVSFVFLLWVPTDGGSSVYSVWRQINFWLIVSLFLSLTYLGSCHPEYPYLVVCQLFSVIMVLMMLVFKLY
uniref:Cytochrome b n=1 Tax=Echinococcus granulosus sensu lato genotype G7 TaxID=2212969 RepID=A0A2Z4GQK5_9CEST|nr:cytochrome b [Echinococcus granulosus sensu lato genotype G7]AWW03720.1 cytochrome b [Echinococcus granulosus sensu lato genotype G7]AWW03732.1 cytochrome b [Echinococcus granulosus sensu lato genotype G7]AWW03744.1 cytochrome b [Echinococcus granulosus sensu lato genotype G7]AWW03756.1 cytochrome b [Echinococcus granulosus sensu lato genotype G7]AWW03768.1 cytochrome b [Echinococcus granulosus sensu lato genotype G7]